MMRLESGLRKSRVVVSVVVLVCVFCSAALGQYGGGSGTAEDPYLIYTPGEMYMIGAMILDCDKHFRLMANIDLSAYTGTSFFIIGSSAFPFAGVFDGNGHTISSFTYTTTGTDNIGVFGYVDGPGAEIKDLGLINPSVDGGNGSRVGALVGRIEEGSITSCYVEGGSVSGNSGVGGLVGSNDGTISNCSSNASVSGTYLYATVGGLAGSNVGTITDCHSEAVSVSGGSGVGGLVGSNDGTISNCSSNASVSGTYSLVGGLAGSNGAAGGRISNSYATGNVSGTAADPYHVLSSVGGLVGNNHGTITNCYSTASVSPSASNVLNTGGLVGYNSVGHISNSYATGSVSGANRVGGLVGWNYSTIANCYSTGSVSGTTGLGGLVGSGVGAFTDSFWDIQSSGRSTSSGGTGKTTAEMQDINTFLAGGWDFVNQADGPSDDWAGPGRGGGYMILWWQLPEDQLPALPTFSGGTGEEDDPYLIATSSDLNRIGHNPRLMEAHFELINDIDLAGIDFFFIGSRGRSYRGVFDGSGHTISNLTYSWPPASYIGLFGAITGANAGVKDLRLIDPNIDAGAGDYVGSLVGYIGNGTISGCYVDGGSVSGGGSVGGLVGENSSGAIINCNGTGSVSGTDYCVGGLVGDSMSGTITKCHSNGIVLSTGKFAGGLVGRGGVVTDCFSTCDVSGLGVVGGLVGENWGYSAITDCYSTGDVSGNNVVGGLVGNNKSGTISASFWDVQTSGRSNMCGSQESEASGCNNANGKTTGQMQTESTFSFAGWDFFGESTSGTEGIWRMCNEGAEYPQLSWQYLLGDFWCPDGVEINDLAVLCEQWLQAGAYSADIAPRPAGDGIVNFPDFAALADNWLTGL